MAKEIKEVPESKSTAAEPSHSNSDEKSTAVAAPPLPASTSTCAVQQTHEADEGGQRNRESVDMDIALGQVEQEKRLSFIKAWEESEKSKALNKAQKKLSALDAWENSKKVSVEAKLKEIEEELEKKRAEYSEKMKNMVAQIHKQAQEKRATVQAQKGKDILMIEQKASKYRATGHAPKKFLSCVSF